MGEEQTASTTRLAGNLCGRPFRRAFTRGGCWTLAPASPRAKRTVRLTLSATILLSAVFYFFEEMSQKISSVKNSYQESIMKVFFFFFCFQFSRIEPCKRKDKASKIVLNSLPPPFITKNRHYCELATAPVQQEVMQNAVRPQTGFLPCLCQPVIYFKHSPLHPSCLKYDKHNVSNEMRHRA